VRSECSSCWRRLRPTGAMPVPISRDNFPRRYSVVADVRRQWSDAEKQRIVAEAERPNANVSAVARRHGITPGLLFRWRRMARDAQAHTAASMFVPVTLALPPAVGSVSAVCPDAPPRPNAGDARRDDRIEIELRNGRLVRVGAGVDTDALMRVLDLLDRQASSCEAPDGRQKP
jgi:transposase-like protein